MEDIDPDFFSVDDPQNGVILWAGCHCAWDLRMILFVPDGNSGWVSLTCLPTHPHYLNPPPLQTVVKNTTQPSAANLHGKQVNITPRHDWEEVERFSQVAMSIRFAVDVRLPTQLFSHI